MYWYKNYRLVSQGKRAIVGTATGTKNGFTRMGTGMRNGLQKARSNFTQKTLVLSVQDGADGIAALGHERGFVITALDFREDEGRRRKRDVLDNVEIGDLGGSIHGECRELE